MVTYATLSDLPKLVEIAKSFFAEAGLPAKLVPAVWVQKWAALINAGVGFILKKEVNGEPVGALGFVATEDLNDGELTANEAFWFILPQYRGRGFELLMKYEEEAKAMGCARCNMIHLSDLQPERLGELYVKRGYKKTETSYFKKLN